MNIQLANAYFFHRVYEVRTSYNHATKKTSTVHVRRAFDISATKAMALAQADVAKGTTRYKPTRYARNNGPVVAGELLWVEDTEAYGLRKVGEASDIAKLDHNGWYCDAHQDDTLAGYVWQLPGCDKKPRFVAGYPDKNNSGAARICFDIFEGDAPHYVKPSKGWCGYWSYHDNATDHDACKDAARRADHYAQRDAEEQREYDEAWHAGSQAAGQNEIATDARKELLALIKEAKPTRSQWAIYPLFRSALCDKVNDLIDTIAEARKERDKLREDNQWKADAFNEGYGA